MTPQQELELLELEAEAARSSVKPVRFPVDISGRQGSVDMGSEMSRGEKLAAGIASGATRIAHGLGFGGPNAAQDRQTLGDIVKGAGGVGTSGEFGAEMAITAPAGLKLATLAGKAVNAIPWVPKFLKTAAASKPGMAAVEGSAGGAVLSPDDRTQGAVIGGATGPLFQQAFNRGGRVLAEPIPQSAEGNALRNRGIDVTTGQGADPNTARGRIYKTVEGALAQAPGVGYPTMAARERALRQYQQDALRQTTPTPGNIRPDKTNLSNLRDIANADLDDAYRGVLKGQMLPKKDFHLIRDLTKTLNDPQFSALDPKDVASAQRFLSSNLMAKLRKDMPAQELFELQTMVRRQAYKQTNETLKDLYLKAADDVYTSLDRQIPGAKAALDALKPTRMNYGVMERTMDRTSGSGSFKPSTLRSASRNRSKTLEDLGRKGEEVFGNSDPMVQRAVTLAGLLGLGYSTWEHGPVGVAAPTALALIASRKSASKALSGKTALQRRMAAELARGNPMTSGALAAQVGQQKEEE